MEPSQMTQNDNLNELSNDRSERKGAPPQLEDNANHFRAGPPHESDLAYGGGYKRQYRNQPGTNNMRQQQMPRSISPNELGQNPEEAQR